MRKRVKDALEQIAEETGEALLHGFVARFPYRPRYAVLSEDGDVLTCDVLTWARFMEGNPQRIIKQEPLKGGHRISTVFLGLDHGYNPKGPQLWFETMIFEPPTGKRNPITGRVRTLGDEIFCDRYETLKEALEGHEAAKRWFERQEL